MWKKVIIVSLVLSVVATCILSREVILSFFQASGGSDKKVTVVEGQVSVVEFDDKTFTFVKVGKLLGICPWLPNGTNCITPSEGSVYHWMGIEITVSQVREDWFVLLVKPEWK